MTGIKYPIEIWGKGGLKSVGWLNSYSVTYVMYSIVFSFGPKTIP